MFVLITYKLKDSVSREEFRAYSSKQDQPAVLRQPGIHRYDIYEVTEFDPGDEWPPGVGAEDGDSCHVFEVVEADSIEAWREVDRQPELKEPNDIFWGMCEPGTLRVVYADQIPPEMTT